MFKPIHIIGIVVFFILGLFSFGFSQESMTITTYYPSPYGSYNDIDVSGRIIVKARIAAPAAYTDAAQIYAIGATAELYTMDEAGNATLQTPHDKNTGEWIFYSKNIKTGRVVRVEMEDLVRAVEELTGKKFMTETLEEVENNR